MKIATLGLIAGAALLLTACSGDDPAAESPEPTTGSTVSAESPEPSGEPTIGGDDALCAAARESLEDSIALEAKVNELQEMLQDTGFMTGGDGEIINAWGSDVLALTETSQAFYQVGITETAGEDVNADFVAMDGFVTTYTVPVATAAAEAETVGDFFLEISGMLTDPEVQDVLTEAPAAASNIAVYIADRCGITG